jgi:hypothetical protein
MSVSKSHSNVEVRQYTLGMVRVRLWTGPPIRVVGPGSRRCSLYYERSRPGAIRHVYQAVHSRFLESYLALSGC